MAHFPSCALCLSRQEEEEGPGPWDLLVLFQVPWAELRSQTQCNDSVHSSERRGCGLGLHVTQAHPHSGCMGVGQTGSRVCLQTEKSLQGGGCPQGQLLRVRVLCRGESGHVAGDGAEGVEQGGLHAGLQEEQVHMDLL